MKGGESSMMGHAHKHACRKSASLIGGVILVIVSILAWSGVLKMETWLSVMLFILGLWNLAGYGCKQCDHCGTCTCTPGEEKKV